MKMLIEQKFTFLDTSKGLRIFFSWEGKERNSKYRYTDRSGKKLETQEDFKYITLSLLQNLAHSISWLTETKKTICTPRITGFYEGS